MKKITGQLTISRVNSSHEPDFIEIRIRDEKASIEFVTAKLELDKFSAAVTGLAYTPCEVQVRKLEKVGKSMQSGKLEFRMPECRYDDRKSVATETAIKEVMEGWFPDCYFNSQDSFFTKDGKNWARTIMRRWIDY